MENDKVLPAAKMIFTSVHDFVEMQDAIAEAYSGIQEWVDMERSMVGMPEFSPRTIMRHVTDYPWGEQ